MVQVETKIELRVFLTTIIVLGVMVLLAGFSSYFIQAGELVPMEQDGRSVQVYKAIDQTPIPIWKILLSPLLCITGKNGVKIIVLILFILIIGGSFAILNRSGVLPGIVSGLVTKFSDRRRLFLVINVIVFSLMGSCLGILEEIAPMVLIFVPLSHRMGWDSITGVAIPFLSAGFGFAAATFNPFTVGTAQRLAGVPLFSGLEIRIPFWILTTLLVILYMLYYTRKIEKDPKKSPTYEMDQKIKQTLNLDIDLDEGGGSKKSVAWMIFCFGLIAAAVLGGTKVSLLQELAFPLIMLVFLIMGIGAGLLSGSGLKKIGGFFLKGLSEFSPAIVLVLMAASVGYLVEEGNILDTILFHLSEMTRDLGKSSAVMMIYGFQMVMNALVPSGSGQAVLTIPILAPLGDILEIKRQVVVLAYQFGDGFSNLLWPTNPMLLIAIGLGKVSYKAWVKWVLPIQLILLAMCSAVLLIVIQFNLG
jgi:uncharacterized ion transporter superfamily protein YfcC